MRCFGMAFCIVILSCGPAVAREDQYGFDELDTPHHRHHHNDFDDQDSGGYHHHHADGSGWSGGAPHEPKRHAHRRGQLYPPIVASPIVPQYGLAPAASWYACDNPAGYYPYVGSCLTQWRQLPAQPSR
jgi:hypothetical protein